MPITYCPQARVWPKATCGPAIIHTLRMPGNFLPRNRPAKMTLINSAGNIVQTSITCPGNTPFVP